MAVLYRPRDGRVVSVAARTLVGRFPSCELALTDSKVSGNHVLLLHDAEGWWVKPHVTRNGTFLDGLRLAPGQRHPVREPQTRLRVGSADERWTWLDLGPPGPAATGDASRLCVAQDAVLALPNEEDPICTITSVDGRWHLHLHGDMHPVTDGESVQIGGESFTLWLPANLRGGSEVTVGEGDPAAIRLELTVSPDGDEIRSSVLVIGDQRRELRVRRHTHLLLELAEARIVDASRGLPNAAQGWVEVSVLCRRLGLTTDLLHLRTHRARAQLTETGLRDASGLIEDRGERSRRQMRLGIGNVSVHTTP